LIAGSGLVAGTLAFSVPNCFIRDTILAYTSDTAAILRRFPKCRILSKPASDEALLRAVIELLRASE
jgi:hypothetical protein